MILIEIHHQMPPEVYECQSLAEAVTYHQRPIEEWLASTDKTFKAVFEDDDESENIGYTREITDDDRREFLARDLYALYQFETSAEAIEFDWSRCKDGYKVIDKLKIYE